MAFDYNDPTFLIAVGIAVLLVAIVIAVVVSRLRKRTAELRKRFGAEYDVALREDKARHKTESKLQARIDRVQHLKIRELTVTERARYLADWEVVQSRFVDHPRGAVTEADELVNALMLSLGYPLGGGAQQRADDISVDHSRLVASYRSANAITVRAGRNEATTEELRTAMIHYRALFDELLQIKKPVQESTLA